MAASMGDGSNFRYRLGPMAKAPIPERIPPLFWRAPAFLWIPAGLGLAIGWPALLFLDNPAARQLALICGASVFAMALISIALRWTLRGAPKARRVIVRHVVVAGAIASLAAPFALTTLMAAAANYQHAGAGENLSFSMSLAMAPLALLLGLPAALISGVIFAWVAMVQPPIGDASLAPSGDPQPFR